MGKEMRGGNCAVFVRGVAVAIWVYLVIVAVEALLVVNGIVPEKAEIGMVAGAGLVAAMIGGTMVVGQGALGRLSAAMINSAIFAGVLVAVKLMAGTPVIWSDCGWLQLVCIFVGGAVPGLRRFGKKKRGRRGSNRPYSKGRV